MNPPVPVNLITGFLGVGKTTAVRHLLAHRPPGQRWAVLVNEFGEIGVDGTLLDDTGVAVTEVPGGCVCCVSSQAFTVGLNRLIREQRPERILIEPTGLGHPAQIIATLTGPFYQGVLDVRATITLLDARHLASPRHREHPVWQDQVHLADVLVASKADLYTDAERDAFARFAADLSPAKTRLAIVASGEVDPVWLDLPRLTRQAAFPEAHAFLQAHHHDHGHPAPASGGDWLMLEGRGDGYSSVGWRLDATITLEAAGLKRWLDSVSAERVKGVLRTDQGWLKLNRGEDGGDWRPVDVADASRLEIIAPGELNAAALDGALRALACKAANG